MQQLLALFGIQEKKEGTPKITLRQLVRFPHYETIFKYIFFAMLAIIGHESLDIFPYKKYAETKQLRSFPLGEVKWLIVGIVLIHIGKTLNNWLSYKFVLNNLPDKFSGADRVLRAQKVVKWVYDSVYYSASTITAYILFKDEKWFPSELGGKNFEDTFSGFPNMPENSWVPIYYMIQTASHVHALLLLMVHGTKIELKYWEYLLHHTLAVSLLYFSAIYNTECIGIVVLILHDMSDFFLSFGRVYGDLNAQEKIGVYTCFSLIQISWLYTRVYVFPIKIFDSIYNLQIEDELKNGIRNQIGHMLVLYMMHIYWTIFMIKVGLGIFTSGRYKNVYDNRENKLDHKKD